MTQFTDAPWSSPEADLDAADFCACCLIDYNEGEKVKANCKLPVRSRPGGPVNKNALRNAASRIFQMAGVPVEVRRKAAASLVRLMKEAEIDVGDVVRRLAGMK